MAWPAWRSPRAAGVAGAEPAARISGAEKIVVVTVLDESV
jgi:hypothetical protein